MMSQYRIYLCCHSVFIVSSLHSHTINSHNVPTKLHEPQSYSQWQYQFFQLPNGESNSRFYKLPCNPYRECSICMKQFVFSSSCSVSADLYFVWSPSPQHYWSLGRKKHTQSTIEIANIIFRHLKNKRFSLLFNNCN
jgi:hypothetical protein